MPQAPVMDTFHRLFDVRLASFNVGTMHDARGIKKHDQGLTAFAGEVSRLAMGFHTQRLHIVGIQEAHPRSAGKQTLEGYLRIVPALDGPVKKDI